MRDRVSTLVAVGATCALAGVLVGQHNTGAQGASNQQIYRALRDTARNTAAIERDLHGHAQTSAGALNLTAGESLARLCHAQAGGAAGC